MGRPGPSGASWHRTVLLFALASFVETFGFGHLTAFTPLYLARLGVPPDAIPPWTGLLSAASFILGLPLAPMWGVWADRYSRKLIIIRSTVIEGVIFLLFGLAGELWHLVVARMLVGFILGNTGVMYAVLSGVVPRHQLAMAIGLMTAGSTLGFTVGPIVGGWLITLIDINQLFLLDAAISWAAAALLIVGFRERRSLSRGSVSTWQLLRALPGNVRASPLTLPLFGLYFIVGLGANLQGPFVPLLVAEVYGGADLPVAIGAVMLVTGALSAICSPLLGKLAGRVGHEVVLVVALVGGAAAALGQAVARDYLSLLISRAALGITQGGTGPLIVSVIALATPDERRASVLSLTLFPTNLGHMGGGLLGSLVAVFSLRGAFVASAAVLGGAAALSLRLGNRIRQSQPTGRPRPV